MKIKSTKHILLSEQDLMDIIIPRLVDDELLSLEDDFVIEATHFKIYSK